MQNLHLWKRILKMKFYFFQKNSPYSLNDTHTCNINKIDVKSRVRKGSSVMTSSDEGNPSNSKIKTGEGSSNLKPPLNFRYPLMEKE